MDNAKLRLSRGMYAPFLAEWFRFFPKKQTLLLSLNDFTGDVRGSLNNITSFLGLKKFPKEQVLDIGRHYDRWFIAEEDRSMMPETRAILDQFYKPFNQMLVKLLGSEKWAFGLA